MEYDERRPTMIDLFTQNLLPVFLAAGAGYLLAARTRAEPQTMSHAVFFVFAPCLIFQVIVESRLPADALLKMTAFTFATLLGLAALAAGVAWMAGWSRPLTSAVVLVAMLPNAGNFGLSINQLAFGDPGLAQAGIFFVTGSIVTYTLGVLVASLGRTSIRTALAGLPRVPTVWAVVLAFALRKIGWELPSPVARTVELLSAACIPVFLVIVGMQLRVSRLRGPYHPIAVATGLRLIGGAAIGSLFAALFALEGTARQAGILQASMPSAVICIVLATEYDVEPGFVTGVVLVTTLLCPLTLTPLLAWLG